MTPAELNSAWAAALGVDPKGAARVELTLRPDLPPTLRVTPPGECINTAVPQPHPHPPRAIAEREALLGELRAARERLEAEMRDLIAQFELRHGVRVAEVRVETEKILTVTADARTKLVAGQRHVSVRVEL